MEFKDIATVIGAIIGLIVGVYFTAGIDEAIPTDSEWSSQETPTPEPTPMSLEDLDWGLAVLTFLLVVGVPVGAYLLYEGYYR